MLETIQSTFQVRCQGPGLVPQYACYLLLYLHLYIIIIDIYNYVSESLRKVIIYLLISIQKHQGKQSISERFINHSLMRFIPWLSRKLFYSELAKFSCQLFLIPRFNRITYYTFLAFLRWKQMYLLILLSILQGPLGSLYLTLSVLYIYFASFYGMRKWAQKGEILYLRHVAIHTKPGPALSQNIFQKWQR